VKVRRVVTGTKFGKAVVVSDERVEPITLAMMPGSELHSIWGSDGPVPLPSDGQRPPGPAWFPPVGGFRFLFFTLAPETVTPAEDLDFDAASAEMKEKLPGLFELLEPDSPGMHRSDTIDIIHVVSGEVTLELDDGAKVDLRAGDVVVQSGTRHAWHNRADVPCVMTAMNVGAPAPS
jgi:mannose-6-phosphate isomerase-like protein (cupin superfamily)